VPVPIVHRHILAVAVPGRHHTRALSLADRTISCGGQLNEIHGRYKGSVDFFVVYIREITG
jgi:hypothetical protein